METAAWKKMARARNLMVVVVAVVAVVAFVMENHVGRSFLYSSVERLASNVSATS